MKTITATTLRQNLFHVLARASRSLPTRIRYKKGEAIITSYRQFLSLGRKTKMKNERDLQPLVRGKIVKPLGKRTDAEVLHYCGIVSL